MRIDYIREGRNFVLTGPASFLLDPVVPLNEDVLVDTKEYRIGNELAVVKPGFRWRASGPTINSPTTRRASLLHDCLYVAMARGDLPHASRAAADQNMLRILEEDGAGRIRRWYWWAGVRLFGWYWLSRGWQ